VWTWLAVGVTAYLVFLAGVIVVLRAAKARARAERAADAEVPTAAPSAIPDRPAPEGLSEVDAGRAHPVTDEHPEALRHGDPATPAPPPPPSSRSRG
jgi:hypothetical protein